MLRTILEFVSRNTPNIRLLLVRLGKGPEPRSCLQTLPHSALEKDAWISFPGGSGLR